MSVKISELSASAQITSDDFLPIVDSGSLTTKRASASQILDYVTGSTFNSLTVTELTASNVSGATAQFTIITASYTGSGIGLYDLTASGISNFTNDVRAQFSEGSNITIAGGVISSTGGSGSPGGTNTTIQFNSGSTFSGSSNLIYEYTTNTLSGTTAQFTIVTGSTITGSLAKFTTLSASTAEFSGSILIYGTASLSSNPSAAYIIYSSSMDKLVAFPGLYVSGNLTGSALGSFQTVSASTYLGLPSSSGGTPGGTNTSIQFNSGSTFSGSTNLIYDYTTNILSGTTAQFVSVTASFSGNINGTSSHASNASLLNGTGSSNFALLASNNTFTGINSFTNEITGTTAYFSSNVYINGTASIAFLNTISQSSLLIGDKYITILSGAADHVSLDGSGILWGSGSTGPTVNELGANAHLRYRNSLDKLEIFPGLYVSGSTSISENLIVTGSITELSTRRIKTNIKSLNNELITISKLNPVSYTRLDDGRKEYGFISEEVREVYPEFVVGEGISYPKMVSILVSAVKELTDKVEKQQSEIEILKNTRGNL